MNLGFIPCLWADDGDCVLVDDVQYAVKAASRLGCGHADVLFLSAEQLKGIAFDGIEPWGWDRCVVTQLHDAGVSADLLPSEQGLDDIRSLSNRVQTADALSFIRTGIEKDTCGESLYCTSVKDAHELMTVVGDVVVKAPWSSSGRGLRYVHGSCSDSTAGWISRTISAQGGVMMEPYYNKVKDFGMEFYSHGNGMVEYCGISLFETVNGAYMGNIIAEDTYKLEILRKFISED